MSAFANLVKEKLMSGDISDAHLLRVIDNLEWIRSTPGGRIDPGECATLKLAYTELDRRTRPTATPR